MVRKSYKKKYVSRTRRISRSNHPVARRTRQLLARVPKRNGRLVRSRAMIPLAKHILRHSKRKSRPRRYK